jgi:hypothetical protein
MLYKSEKEFKERQRKMDIAWALFEENEYDVEKTCSECPFRAECKALELCYGCGVWEEMQGEDL